MFLWSVWSLSLFSNVATTSKPWSIFPKRRRGSQNAITPNQVENSVVPDTTYGLHISFPTHFQKYIPKVHHYHDEHDSTIIITMSMIAPSLSTISVVYNLRILVAQSILIHLCNKILLLGKVYSLLCISLSLSLSSTYFCTIKSKLPL